MSAPLAGSRALITGATSGIGRAIATAVADLGAEVIVHGRDCDRGVRTVEAVESRGGKATFIAADLTDADSVRRLAAEAGRVDILINNAGIYEFGATPDTDDKTFDLHVNINLRAPYILAQELIPAMAARGAGAVVNLSTVAASMPARQAGIYGATKAGLELLTRLWADEFGRSGVRVNAVAAGPTNTPGTAVIPGLAEGMATTTALGRVASVKEIANVVAFLITPAASYVTGAVVEASGGRLAIAPG